MKDSQITREPYDLPTAHHTKRDRGKERAYEREKKRNSDTQPGTEQTRNSPRQHNTHSPRQQQLQKPTQTDHKQDNIHNNTLQRPLLARQRKQLNNMIAAEDLEFQASQLQRQIAASIAMTSSEATQTIIDLAKTERLFKQQVRAHAEQMASRDQEQAALNIQLRLIQERQTQEQLQTLVQVSGAINTTSTTVHCATCTCHNATHMHDHTIPNADTTTKLDESLLPSNTHTTHEPISTTATITPHSEDNITTTYTDPTEHKHDNDYEPTDHPDIDVEPRSDSPLMTDEHSREETVPSKEQAHVDISTVNWENPQKYEYSMVPGPTGPTLRAVHIEAPTNPPANISSSHAEHPNHIPTPNASPPISQPTVIKTHEPRYPQTNLAIPSDSDIHLESAMRASKVEIIEVLRPQHAKAAYTRLRQSMTSTHPFLGNAVIHTYT